MSTHNIGFYEDLTNIIFELSSYIIKYAPYFFCCHFHWYLAAVQRLYMKQAIKTPQVTEIVFDVYYTHWRPQPLFTLQMIGVLGVQDGVQNAMLQKVKFICFDNF